MLETDLLRLRAMEPEDLPFFVRWLNDEVVSMYLGRVSIPMSLKQEEAWFEAMLQKPSREQPLCIEIKEEETWKLIGNTAFFDFDDISRVAEVGILIGDRNYLGKGWGTKAMKMMLQFGFERLNLNRVRLRVVEENQRAFTSYLKSGFVHEGLLRQEIYSNGKYHNMIVMGILKEEWQQKNEQK